MKVIKLLNQRNEKKNTLTKKTTKKDINKELKKGKNRYSSNKLYKLNGNNCIDDFKVNKLENNLEIKKNIEKNNENNIIKFNNIYNISYFIIISYLVIFSQFIKCNNRKIELASSYIKLKTNGTGAIKLYSNIYQNLKPDIVIINDKINHTIDKTPYIYNFSKLENNINNITLIWNNPLDSTNNMFQDCKNIIEIDLSNFDASEVSEMKSMFCGCSSLYSINFSNINTSKVNNMNSMFNGCSSLISLDLSNFNTSNVINMNFLFYNCKKLKMVNLKRAKINHNINIDFNYPPNLTICSEDEKWGNKFNLPYIQYITCINNENSFVINYIKYEMRCYKKNFDHDYPYQICRNYYFKKTIIVNNISYINFYGDKKDDFFDDRAFNHKLNYNCIESKDKNKIELNFSIYKNYYLHLTNFLETDIALKIEIEINKFFEKVNLTEIDISKYKTILRKDISIILSTIKNQNNNGNEKYGIIDLGQCENILKNEYNISKNDSLYI